jgi:hypothetical protein
MADATQTHNLEFLFVKARIHMRNWLTEKSEIFFEDELQYTFFEDDFNFFFDRVLVNNN